MEHWYMCKEYQKDVLGRNQRWHGIHAPLRRAAARLLTGAGTLLYRAGWSLEQMVSRPQNSHPPA
ncbi:MAG: hypothetical protein ACQEQU_06210 [Spirochaetota bacterium]